jgi:predicted phosphoribosyltransferase
MQQFTDRRDAGRQLASALDAYAGRQDVVVLALPRGGVPVGYEIARALGVPLDVLVVRKLGVPGQPELAMGAIASGGIRVIDRRIVDSIGIPDRVVEAASERERAELERRERAFRGDRPPRDIHGCIAIVVDDGLATGSTMRAALDAVRTRGPARVVCAVPVAPPETCAALRKHADEMICLVTPPDMYAVGLWYEDFAQTEDDEVRALLEAAAQGQASVSIEAAAHPQ